MIIPSIEDTAAVAKAVLWLAHTDSGFMHQTKCALKIRFKN